MDKYALAKKIASIAGLDNEEKSALLGLLRSQKKYGVVWEEKPEDTEERLREELPVLTELKERAIISEEKNAPNHILIESDNLEALTTLTFTHAGKIDIIYIDPPYNTGNKDFVYNDRYVDAEDGYRHSKWLSFMSKRLKIAQKILSEKGVIFISIGEQEVAQLILLCNEIFKERNQLGIIPRVQKKGNDKGNFFSPSVDYVLAYALAKDKLDPFFIKNKAEFPLVETSGPHTGEHYEATKSLYQSSLDARPNQRYYIECPDGSLVIPPGTVFPSIARDGEPVKPTSNNDKCWRWSFESYLEKKDRLVFKRTKRSPLVTSEQKPAAWNVYTKRYQKEAQEKGNVPSNYIDDCINALGTARLSELGIDFSFAKPCELIMTLIEFTDKEKDITILDFFAGSGTTLDATMQLNAKDKGRRRCILVTNNENGICENVTYERNKRVIKGYTTPKGEAKEGLKTNTLRYYKTTSVGRERNARNMRQLINLCTDMLCIKEDLYREQTQFGQLNTYKGIFRYFAEGKKQMLVIYNEKAIETLVGEIYSMETEGKIKVYVFSPSEDPWKGSFEEVEEKVTLCALPMAIYNAYRRTLPEKRDTDITFGEHDTDAYRAEASYRHEA